MTELQTIISIAKIVREAVLEISQNKNLAGYCGIASVALSKELNKHGFKNYVWEGEFKGEGHAWIVYKDKIIDITASQFGLEDIHICKAYEKGCGYKALYKLESFEDFNGWNQCNRPNDINQKKINDAIQQR